jgi:hypothetical protein
MVGCAAGCWPPALEVRTYLRHDDAAIQGQEQARGKGEDWSTKRQLGHHNHRRKNWKGNGRAFALF